MEEDKVHHKKEIDDLQEKDLYLKRKLDAFCFGQVQSLFTAPLNIFFFFFNYLFFFLGINM